MAEYIEREALLKSLCNLCDGWCENTECNCVNCKSDHRCDMVVEIAEFPAADVAPVVHGRWIPDGNTVCCSECKTMGSPQWKGCPVCMARMDGE